MAFGFVVTLIGDVLTFTDQHAASDCKPRDLCIRLDSSLSLLAFGMTADAGVPACCRRNGKHHCMMRNVPYRQFNGRQNSRSSPVS